MELQLGDSEGGVPGWCWGQGSSLSGTKVGNATQGMKARAGDKKREKNMNEPARADEPGVKQEGRKTGKENE